MKIPVLDLQLQYQSIREEIDAAVLEVLASGNYILGPNVQALEQEIARLCGCRYGIGLASGTDALRLALDALGIGPGDEVITTAFTFIATANTISRAGAKPVFVDIEPRTFNLDPALVEAAITGRTRAILLVHLYGQPSDMGDFMDLAARYRLPVVEDSAQALEATWQGRPVSSFGDVGCLSFYPTKNLGACGDGGMAVTNDAGIADRLDTLRRHGGRVRYHHERLGYNSRLDELQAAILRVKLRYLSAWTAARQRIAARYDELLADLPVVTPYVAPEATHVYHQYTIRAPRRDALRAYLAEQGIETAIYYPVPLHRQEMYADLGLGEGSLPETEKAAREVLSLPIYPELTDEQVQAVAGAIRRFYTDRAFVNLDSRPGEG
ncbi:MAG TPA: DegT/DnrJ/EryC1/StrS family aminotransferase [Anaerolineae bacterium]|nr:DegT/DnrJ/EryC1/StrS family aminotransferase [Anaerolineae bacterium]